MIVAKRRRGYSSIPKDYIPDQVGAYILASPREFTNLEGEPVPDTSMRWEYTQDAETIVKAPINDVIFVNEDDNKNHDLVRQEILNRSNIDPVILKHQKIFKVFATEYAHRVFETSIDMELDLARGYDYESNTKVFAEYIKDIGYSFKSRKIMQFVLWNNSFKDLLNKANIYIRPIKKIFEYNPKLAKRQFKIRIDRRKRKPKTSKSNLAREVLQAFNGDLHRIFPHNIDVSIRFRDGWDSSRTKIGLSRSILVLIDFYNFFYQKNSYRNFGSYKTMITIWKNITDQQRQLYPKEFIQWMNTESKIKLKPHPKLQLYNIEKKPKLNIFKISKLKWIHQGVK